MQLLYEFDVREESDWSAMVDTMDQEFDAPEIRETALRLANGAWTEHAAADNLAMQLAPAWPTHRQPPVDRAILRLAYYEMVSGHAPVKVAINEAVELAKRFGAEQSPSFLNGVLDKMAKRLAKQAVERQQAP